MARKPVKAAVNGIWITCQICKSDLFRERNVKLNSSGMEFMSLAWADETATGLICWACGYVHLFANKNIQLYKAE